MHRTFPFVAVALAAGLLISACGDDDDPESSGPQARGDLPTQGELLFTVRGPADVSDGRLTVKTDVVEWFTDRPSRGAGAAPVQQLAENWESLGFAQDPPNAALSGTKDDVTVELRQPEANDGEISFAFKPLIGELPSGDLGFLSVFVDAGMHKDNPTLEQHKDNPTLEQHKDNPTGQEGS